MNVLSLDAPIVALVWQDFFAINFGLKLAPAYRVLLALCAWLAYAADRWLDALKIPQGRAATARHAFAQRHRRLLAAMWLMVFATAGMIASRWLTLELFMRGTALAAFVGLYFVVNQWRKTNRWLRGIKELLIAATFAAASVAWILPLHWLLSVTMLWAVFGWAMLCFLNCFAIAGWEIDQDRAHRQESLVTRWPFLARHFVWAVTLLIAYAVVPMVANPTIFPWHIATALTASAVILGFLNIRQTPGNLRNELLPVLADGALLTPLFFRIMKWI